MRSNHYSSPESADEAAEEFVTAPGHGAVGVFQSPQPVRPRGGPVDTTLDIDSPFLDLFGGAAPPTPVAPATPASESSVNPPPDDPDHDFDFGFDFDDRPTVANGSAPPATPVEPRPIAVAPTPTPVTDPPVAGPPVSEPLVAGPPVSAPPAFSAPPAPRDPAFEDDQDGPAGPWGTREQVEPIEPFSRAPIGPKADFFQESGAPADPDLDEWPDFYDWPPAPQAGAAPAQSAGPVSAAPLPAAPVSTPPLWQTVGNGQARPPQPGPVEAYAPQPLLEDPSPEAALPVPVPEKAPAKRKEKAPARRKKEPKNLPAKQEKLKQPKPVALRPHKLKFNDRDPVMELEISEIAGHLTFTQSTVTAWYYLPEVRWAFRPDAEREALLSAISEQYAGLAGFRLHLRRTNRPFPADEWARTVDSFTAKPLPDVRGGTSWSDHLVAAQRHLLSVNHAEGQTYLGVTFARRSLGDTFSERVLRIFGRGTSDGERRKLNRAVEQFDEVLNAFGMRGRRVTPQELEWLLFRSVALCMAPPGPLSPVTNGQWDTGDLLALTEQVERYRTPYGSTVKLVNRMTGEERHVAVLSVGRMEPLEIPEKHEPWMHFHERLPWPMELSSRLDILGSGSSFKNLEHRLRMIRSQQLDYAEHGIDAPPELERLAKRALVIGDEMTTGLPVESARAHGWHRIAVGGATREECLERARRLIQLYSRELRISLQHPKNQDQLAREFIPGEPIANTGYVRRMPVKLLAAALPQAASTVGDRRGDLIGRTAGTCRRPVFLDLHFPMEVRERSGLGVFVAEPGGGKSTLMGALGYLNARRGVQVTLLDPSGPLARLCQMPELRPYSRVLNLTGSEQGTLAPYALIPTPVRSEFATGPGGDREYEIAVSNARAERRMLVQDICSMLVPPQVAKEASTATLLRHAVRQVPAEESSTLDDVVRTLQGLDDDEGRELANLLLDTAEMPLALLFFGSPPQHLLGADAALTVITMAGLRLPDLKIEREYWSAEESLALPMLHTAHRLAVRRCYGGSMSSRKMVGLDEAHFMEGWRSGRSFLVRLARDSRKWNLAALVASQNPRDILGLDVQNLVSTVFVGRIAEDQEIASEALRLLRVPVHDGYEATLASLSQIDTSSSSRLGFREFVMRDVDGRVQKVRVDVSYVEGLLEHLDTTPTAAKAAPAIPMLPSDLEV
ncbi:ATP-binding protein [Paractinoplanes lichenicola]|uniref:ATP-binding protein n=1 Tax=Paractinoplanes lichenicola TaxID=2802976 RepID=UPI0027DEA010|nr:ATP-binding protein [Actinoplanes lichenicola]